LCISGKPAALKISKNKARHRFYESLKGLRLRHPTFQRIFGRTGKSLWGCTFAETPLNAISRSNWSPESAKMNEITLPCHAVALAKTGLDAPREDGSWFRAEWKQLQVTNNRNQSSMKTSSRLNLPLWLIATILPAAMLVLSAQTSRAGSATWNLNPATGDWNTATNWTPATVPNGPSDTATFAFSNTTGVSISAFTEVNGIVFNAGASAFTITVIPTSQFTFTFSGTGIANNSGILQNFVSGANASGQTVFIGFTNSATAGNSTMFTNQGSAVSGAGGGVTVFSNTATAGNGAFINNSGVVSNAGGGQTQFLNSSIAGQGTFTNNGGVVSGAGGGIITFDATSSAGNGSFTNNDGVGGARGGLVQFFATSTAGDAIFTNNSGTVSGAEGGSTSFNGSSTAGNGTFTNNAGTVSGANGGSTNFFNTSTAGNATFTNNGGSVSGAGDGLTIFFDSSNADNSNLISTSGTGAGGVINFSGDSTGGTARVQVFGNGTLDIGPHNAPGVTIGSIEGSGIVLLGANNLTVGSNNLDTTFSGIIQDGGVGGSFTKTGGGTLSLTNTNIYSGGTVISAGTLQASQDGALGGGNVSLINPGVTLTLQSGPTNNYIADTANLIVVSGSTVNLNFSGNPDTIGGLIVDGVGQPAGVYGSAASSAPHQLPVFAGTGRIRVVLLPFTFGSTGSLAAARYTHTATLLPNGNVLVAGGYNGGYLASAELYNPASGTWTATGSLATGRASHTATL
jgi:hypothetical protein